MSFKKLRDFLTFNWKDFANGKQFVALEKKDWFDHDTGKLLGVKYTLVIMEDSTVYRPNANGSSVSNIFEKFDVKIESNIDIPLNTPVELENVSATVYGDFSNQLSVKAGSIKPVVAKKQINLQTDKA